MPRDAFDLHGRSVVVTGGLGRLGLSWSRALVERGASVAILDLSDDLEPFEKRFGYRPPSDALRAFAVDVTDAASVEAATRHAIDAFGVPHGLVHAAALDSPPDAPATENGPFEHYPEASWDRVMEVNAKGAFLCCQRIGGAMAEAGRGSIVLVGSIYGLVSPDQRIYAYRGDGFAKPVAYSVSKSALLNLTRYLATYWAPRGVRVNTLTLAGVFDAQDPAFLAGYLPRVPLGRMADPDEYDGAIVFLLSEASRYMTGSNLVVDGGWTAW